MKRIIYFSVISSILLIETGCSHDKRVENKFALAAESPKIEELTVNEVLKPLDIITTDNYICILHEEKSSGNQIYVYDADTFGFKYDFAKRGQGPAETVALDVMKNARGDTLDLIDQANYRHLTYILNPNAADLLDDTFLELPNMGPLQETYWVNDSIIIFSTLGRELLTYNTKSQRIVDRFCVSEIMTDCSQDDLKDIGGFHFACRGEDIVIALRYWPRLILGKIGEDFSINIETPELLDTNALNNDKKADRTIYYTSVTMGDDRIVAQYYGFPQRLTQPFPVNLEGQNLKFKIEVYDKSLSPIIQYDPQSDFNRIFLDDNRHRIYYWDAVSYTHLTLPTKRT